MLGGPDLWKTMLVKCSITMVFTCPLLSFCKIKSSFRECNNVVVFPFSFHTFTPEDYLFSSHYSHLLYSIIFLAILWLIRFQRYLPILRTRSYSDLYSLIHPPRMPLEIGRRILIQGFIQSTPTLTD